MHNTPAAAYALHEPFRNKRVHASSNFAASKHDDMPSHQEPCWRSVGIDYDAVTPKNM